MWLISARDLQYRLRRFVIAIAVTAMVFGIALTFDGVKRAMQREGPRVIDSFHADRWVVADGATGPFTTTRVIDGSVAPALAASPGVDRADPVVLSRTVVGVDPELDANLIGGRPGGLGAPSITEGRAVRGPGEVVVGAGAEGDVGTSIVVGGTRMRVVGRTADSRYFFGVPTVFVSLRDAQDIVFNGLDLAMAVAVTGRPRDLPAGVRALSNDGVVADMNRPIKSGVDTINIVSVLLWLIAAGIIALIVYLSALERVRDFAVFKATGAPNHLIVGGLVVQATFVSLVAAVVSVGVALLVGLSLPFPAELTLAGFVQLLVVGVVVGGLASLAGVRRALTTDPSVAFGGA
jgi:putative ABC transport system permease protein